MTWAQSRRVHDVGLDLHVLLLGCVFCFEHISQVVCGRFPIHRESVLDDLLDPLPRKLARILHPVSTQALQPTNISRPQTHKHTPLHLGLRVAVCRLAELREV